MPDKKFVYPYGALDAKRNDELDEWRQSYRENISCRKAVQKAIAENFDGFILNGDSALKVISEYGYDRVNHVLANTLQHKTFDGRFSKENLKWAKEQFIPKEDTNLDFIVESHPAVLNGFVNQARTAYKGLKLFDFSHCQDKADIDLEGKVLVLNPTVLKDEYKTTNDQLFYATGGFGCNPDASGRKVFGFFLKDGEETQYNRSDFVGVLKDEHLPDWAKEKLEEMNAPDESQGMTMN